MAEVHQQVPETLTECVDTASRVVTQLQESLREYREVRDLCERGEMLVTVSSLDVPAVGAPTYTLADPAADVTQAIKHALLLTQGERIRQLFLTLHAVAAGGLQLTGGDVVEAVPSVAATTADLPAIPAPVDTAGERDA